MEPASRLIILASVSCILGAGFFYFVSKQWSRFVWWRRLRRGRRGEVKAERILKNRGYRIRATQEDLTATVHIDGREVTYGIRPDAIVTRGRSVYVAEVKTGNYATNPMAPETRRQLLEYQLNLPVDGVVMVNADTGRIYQVEFPSAGRVAKTSPSTVLLALIVGAMIGILCAYLVMETVGS